MLVIFVNFNACNLFISATCFLIMHPGPKYPPTKGEVWPKPQNETKLETIYTFSTSEFKITVTNKTCDTLADALNRFSNSLKLLYAITERRNSCSRPHLKNSSHTYYKHKHKWRRLNVPRYKFLKELRVELKKPCEYYPYFGMDESYKVNISVISTLVGNSVWGVMYGLETISQLFYISSDYCEMQILATCISDFPRYPHRGLMLDTSRHYISVSNILLNLDAMAMNKLNVFHWHIVDDQSFPYQSEIFPELSEQGAYDPSMIYTKSDIMSIVEYARQRGIRVIPEFDVPGHTRSWGISHPEILTKCCDSDGNIIGLGPMHPLEKKTYELLEALFRETRYLFKDKYFHIGGDEVDLSCWLSNLDIQKYVDDNNVTQEHLLTIFINQVTDLLGNYSTPMVWQEVVDSGVPLPKGALVQVWKNEWTKEVFSILLQKYRVVLSSPWYLDVLDNTFEKLYTKDPVTMMSYSWQNAPLSYLIGGEACMWGEMADDTNVLSRVWPRASAASEVLWRGSDGIITRKVMRRIEEHTCRMLRRGIPAQPAGGPGFCVL